MSSFPAQKKETRHGRNYFVYLGLQRLIISGIGLNDKTAISVDLIKNRTIFLQSQTFSPLHLRRVNNEVYQQYQFQVRNFSFFRTFVLMEEEKHKKSEQGLRKHY
jgi:hypothetical protein